jgi:hypothetical protein
LAHSPEALQVLLQLSIQVFLSHAFEHLVQLFILLLQQALFAKDIVHIENNITMVMKRNFFMILIFKMCLIINYTQTDKVRNEVRTIIKLAEAARTTVNKPTNCPVDMALPKAPLLQEQPVQHPQGQPLKSRTCCKTTWYYTYPARSHLFADDHMAGFWSFCGSNFFPYAYHQPLL